MRTSLLLLAILTTTLAAASPAAATGLDEFGRCLGSKGAVFYGASWCPHCRNQKATLGAAMSGIRYVECAPGGGRSETASACTAANVTSYPTWVFGDGSRESGALSIAQLASKTGCPAPSAASKPSARKSAGSHSGSGPKIIEVPRE